MTTTDEGMPPSPDALLQRLEAFYDAVPRPSSRVETIGELTLFVAQEGWPFYARPRLGTSHEFSVTDVDAVRDRQRELDVPESFEWVHDTTPTLAEAARGSGLEVHEHPLLVLDRPLEVAAPDGVRLRVLSAGAPDLARSRATADVGFGQLDTLVGEAGPAERDALAARRSEESLAQPRRLMREGRLSTAVAEDTTGPLAVGSHQVAGDVSEVVGVATLPAARRRGLGAAVTAALVADARARGVDLVFLSASDDAVARIYERVGFRRVGTACIAEPA
jgi:ribosomal protein S18 acetylase RimI-like enzyme